ncbi:MAG: hypothetical protein WC554_12025 [Clostridia bacterium]
MKKDQAKLIIIEVLQKALAGQLKSNAIFNPRHIVDAIIQKVEFESTMGEIVNREVIENIIVSVEDCKKEMDNEFENLDQETDKLLRNFIRGKSHAYQEMLDILNKI